MINCSTGLLQRPTITGCCVSQEENYEKRGLFLMDGLPITTCWKMTHMHEDMNNYISTFIGAP
jgi:hypothetical protein